MKRTFLKMLVVLAVIAGAYGIVAAASPPHTNFRSGYSGASCTSGTACHNVVADKFMPDHLGNGTSYDYNNFCLSCHNTTGEAHDKNAGSPSTNVYVNGTGFDLDGSYSGKSHKFSAPIGGAGTVTPSNTALSGHMPGSMVLCQTCHNAMDKIGAVENIGFSPSWITCVDQGDQKNYSIGLPSTQEHLAHYIRVYRNATDVTPANPRNRKQYLVNPSEYTYNFANGIITFGAAQGAPGTVYIYADIAQPYMRTANPNNTICLDCHADRNDQSVSHEPGTGVLDNHAMAINFAPSAGLHDTLKTSPDSNIPTLGGKVYCTSCHDMHNAESEGGQILRNVNPSDLCTDCHEVNGYDGYSTAFLGKHDGSKHSGATECLDCHTMHRTRNILLVRDKIAGKTVSFKNLSGAASFGPNTGSGVCEACHSATNYHTSDGLSSQHHNNDNCTKCHPHSTGFALGSGTTCDSCHGNPPPPAPSGWTDPTGDAHSVHITYLADASFGGGLTGTAACAECHGADPGSNASHNQSKNSATMDISTWESWSSVGGAYGTASFDEGGTIGTVSTADDTCTNVSCHSISGTRQWGAGPGGLECDSCHSYPGSATNEWSAGNGHLVRYDGVANTHLPSSGYDKANDTYAAMTTDPTKCGLCHSGGTHKSGTVDVIGNGHIFCAPGTDFTVNVTNPGSDVSCDNVKCHAASKSTPNWY